MEKKITRKTVAMNIDVELYEKIKAYVYFKNSNVSDYVNELFNSIYLQNKEDIDSFIEMKNSKNN